MHQISTAAVRNADDSSASPALEFMHEAHLPVLCRLTRLARNADVTDQTLADALSRLMHAMLPAGSDDTMPALYLDLAAHEQGFGPVARLFFATAAAAHCNADCNAELAVRMADAVKAAKLDAAKSSRLLLLIVDVAHKVCLSKAAPGNGALGCVCREALCTTVWKSSTVLNSSSTQPQVLNSSSTQPQVLNSSSTQPQGPSSGMRPGVSSGEAAKLFQTLTATSRSSWVCVQRGAVLPNGRQRTVWAADVPLCKPPLIWRNNFPVAYAGECPGEVRANTTSGCTIWFDVPVHVFQDVHAAGVIARSARERALFHTAAQSFVKGSAWYRHADMKDCWKSGALKKVAAATFYRLFGPPTNLCKHAVDTVYATFRSCSSGDVGSLGRYGDDSMLIFIAHEQ